MEHPEELVFRICGVCRSQLFVIQTTYNFCGLCVIPMIFFSWFFLEATDSHRIFNKLKTKTNWKKLFLDIYRSKIAGLNQKLIKLSGINKNKQKTRNIVRSITSNSIICCEEVKRMLINKSANIRIISINMRGWNSDTAFWKLITQFRWLLKYVRECQNDKHKML